jgi:hypothetical protein
MPPGSLSMQIQTVRTYWFGARTMVAPVCPSLPSLLPTLGKRDATAAITAAIEYAHRHYLVTFLPVGRYLVTSTITCVEWDRLTTTGYIDAKGWPHGTSSRQQPCSLVGEMKSDGSRSTLVVAANTPAFANASLATPVLAFTAQAWGDVQASQPNINFNQIVETIDLEVAVGNPGAAGFDVRGAQGTSLEDVYIRLAPDSYAGVIGLSGSGGSHTNVTVEGGRYGVDGRHAQPGPTFSGLHLRNQTCGGLIYGGFETLSLVAAYFAMGHQAVPAIISGCPPDNITLPSPGCRLPELAPVQACRAVISAQLTLVDSVIDYSQAEPSRTPSPAIVTYASLAVFNTVMLNVSRLAHFVTSNTTASLSDNWSRVVYFAKGETPPLYPSALGPIQYQSHVTLNGSQLPADRLWLSTRSVTAIPSFDDLMRTHGYGSALEYPSWRWLGTTRALNVKAAPYCALGNGFADDHSALQQAVLDARQRPVGQRVVILPKGIYNVSKPLRVPCTVQLVGVSRLATWVVSASRGLWPLDEENNALIYTEPCTTIVLSTAGHLGTVVSHMTISPVDAFSPSASALLWDADTPIGSNWTGHHVWRQTWAVRNYVCGAQGYTAACQGFHPSVNRTSAAPTTVRGSVNAYVTLSGGPGRFTTPAYRHVLVANTSGPVRMYHLNTERAVGEANAEVSW